MAPKPNPPPAHPAAEPPALPTRTAYITRAGFERLRAEYDQLWRVRRPEVVRALSAAAAEGDRSENAEYIYRKKELREIDRRVRYLQTRIPQLKVIDGAPADRSRVFFGARIEIADDSGEVRCYRIVGPDEVDAQSGAISVDSPLARALLKKMCGEVVDALLPGGIQQIELISVEYRE